MLQDGLGSVRNQVDLGTSQIGAAQQYAPYGQVYDAAGTLVGSFGYTGEQTDASGMSYNFADLRNHLKIRV